MAPSFREIAEAAEAGNQAKFFANVELPRTMRAAFIRRQDLNVFDGLPLAERDPLRTVHIGEVSLPPLGPGEALVAVMAASINGNIVWTTTFEPVPTFVHLDHFAKTSPAARRHALDYHIFGSDAAGVVLAVGAGETAFKPGDEVVVHSVWTLGGRPASRDDMMANTVALGYGYETNFGSFADVTLVQTAQLLPKPRHLTWEEAASLPAVSATCYRMLVGEHGARMKQGDVVLIWGAAGGLGLLATQYVLNGGGIPVCVVSSPEKRELLQRFGVEAVIDRSAEGFRFLKDGAINTRELRRFRDLIHSLVDDDPDIVFEMIGQDTFAASVYVAKRGGAVVTCGSSSGHEHVYDNRPLWLGVKNIIGSHVATHHEAWMANRLACLGKLHPALTQTVPLEKLGPAASFVAKNQHIGKVGVSCLAPKEGGGVRDPEMRARLLDQVSRCRGTGPRVAL